MFSLCCIVLMFVEYKNGPVPVGGNKMFGGGK